MRINVGCKEYGYSRIELVRSELQHYLDNVATKYEGDFVEENKRLARDFLSGRNLSRYVGIASSVIIASVALLGLMSPELALAQGTQAVEVAGHIDVSPLDRFFNEVYWTMFKVLMYIATPVWAWVGYILTLGGANNEKRTQAKKVGVGLISGTAVTASAPWATRQLFNLWKLIFG
jgi:hypothetical protein